jgi:hypothetical protein
MQPVICAEQSISAEKDNLDETIADPGFNLDLQLVQSQMNKKINILLLDSSPETARRITEGLFDSPVFNVHIARNLDEAIKIVLQRRRFVWHCWILDALLDDHGYQGLELLAHVRCCSNVVVLSAHASLEMACEAHNQGVTALFDKKPEAFSKSGHFFSRICKLSALTYLLKGAHTDYKRIFKILCDNTVKDAEHWATLASISKRYLHDLCMLHTGMSPRVARDMYYTIEGLLLGNDNSSDSVVAYKCIRSRATGIMAGNTVRGMKVSFA